MTRFSPVLKIENNIGLATEVLLLTINQFIKLVWLFLEYVIARRQSRSNYESDPVFESFFFSVLVFNFKHKIVPVHDMTAYEKVRYSSTYL
jgi:hypothetical protein